VAEAFPYVQTSPGKDQVYPYINTETGYCIRDRPGSRTETADGDEDTTECEEVYIYQVHYSALN
jgi:hypothetical protein